MNRTNIIIFILFIINIPANCDFKDYLSDHFKSNTISSKDRITYQNQLVWYNIQIADATTILTRNGKDKYSWATVEFENIEVPEALSKKFSKKALLAEFNRFEFNQTREIMQMIHKHATWNYDRYGKFKYEIHNYYQNLRILSIEVELFINNESIGCYHLHCEDSIFHCLRPNQDGSFSTYLNNNTVNKLNDSYKRTTMLKKITFTIGFH